jgi:hypothetical protein
VVASIVDFDYDRANTLQRITGLDPSIGEQRYRYLCPGQPPISCSSVRVTGAVRTTAA